MLEFSSISVSSYDAASLADKLTERSGEGWDVVSIVAAGTNVTAYLSRSRTGAESTAASPAGDVQEPISVEAPAQEAPAASEPAFEPVLPASAGATAAATEPAVEEPAGWAVEPEPASTTPVAESTPVESSSWSAGTSTTTATDTGTGTGDDAQPVTEASAVEEARPEETYAATTQTDTAASTASQASSAATAPAGWYADPSGRYELRYWDGSQWTEHVSRAGQQYTDPPVA